MRATQTRRQPVRELFVNLTLREVRGKYRRTVLGNFWSMLNPLASMIIYTAVFSILLRVQPEPGDPSGLDVFAIWLMVGLLAWNFMSGGISAGMGAFVNNSALLTKVYFPRWVLVASTVAAAAFTYAIELAVLSAVLLVFGVVVIAWIPGILLTGLLIGVFAYGLGLALAVLNVYFRDTQHFVAILLQVWFYLTPIVYPPQLIADTQQRILDEQGLDVPLGTLYELNPMLHFIEVMRAFMYDNRLPDPTDVVICFVAAGLSLLLGIAVFRRFSGRVVEEL